MSIIYPGNFVARLNAYRGQGVEAIPGYEFYSAIGVAIVNGSVASGDALELKILSPDLRGDDKPRLDKPFGVPDGVELYRTAIGASNLELKTAGAAAAALTVGGAGGAAVLQNVATETTLEADAGSVSGNLDLSTFTGSTGAAAGTGVSAVTVTANADLELVDGGDQGLVLVEICYFKKSPVPTGDDVSPPYRVEAGQGY